MPLAHITLATRDVTATARFFEDVLGWRPIDRPGNIGRPAAWLEIAPGQELHLIQVDDFEPSPFDREYGRHVALSIAHERFPLLKQKLQKHGAELMAPIRPTPFERFFFRDPNGYIFEIVAAERAPEV
jgi:catechol 2,3-dioxygenase-like lactoylglutathione lyase family enzyme